MMAPKGEAQNRLRKAAKLAHHARLYGYSSLDLATDENCRRHVLAAAGYIERGASLETWYEVFTIMTAQEEG